MPAACCRTTRARPVSDAWDVAFRLRAPYARSRARSMHLPRLILTQISRGPHDDPEFIAPADGLDVLLWAGYSAKKGAVTVTESFMLKGACVCACLPGYVCVWVSVRVLRCARVYVDWMLNAPFPRSTIQAPTPARVLCPFPAWSLPPSSRYSKTCGVEAVP